VIYGIVKSEALLKVKAVT